MINVKKSQKNKNTLSNQNTKTHNKIFTQSTLPRQIPPNPPNLQALQIPQNLSKLKHKIVAEEYVIV